MATHDTAFTTTVAVMNPGAIFTVAVSLIAPSYDDDPDFMELMAHTCTIVRAGEAVASAGSYGHQRKDYDVAPTATYSDIPCRMRSLSAEEIATIGRDSEVVQDWYMDIPARYIPESMKDDTAAARHQVMNVRDAETGEMYKAGPYDVQSVRDMAGQRHHSLLQLRKAGQ
jgi:hypothetical protein